MSQAYQNSRADKAFVIKQFERLFAAGGCQVTDDDYTAFEAKKDLLLQLSEVENSSMALYDMNRGGYAFVRSKFDLQLAYPLNEIFKKEPRYFFELMPLPDIRFTIDTMRKTFDFFRAQDPGNLKEYKLIFEFRLSDPAGNLYRFLQQCVLLEQDREGNIWLVLILNDLIPDRPVEMLLQRKLIHMPSGKICLFNNEKQTSGRMLSQRETEILGLLSQGMQSREISDSLFISVNTVNNHRQNIIGKLNARNTGEALNYARTIGII